MRRIKPNRCGYVSGYICKPISSLNPLFQHTYTNAYATESIATGAGTTYAFKSAWIGPTDSGVLLQGTIDNYAQLPQQFEGFVMTLAPILNMSGNRTAPEVPELECRVDFDPFNSGEEAFLNPETGYMGNPATSKTGFVDFYNQVDPEYKENVYVSVDGSSEHQQLYHTMPVYIEGSTTTPVSGIGYVITGGTNNTFTALTAGPGILEPMLDTELPPIGVDTIPSADIIGDFAMWEFNTINQWQKLVDARLNGLKTVIPTVDYGKINGLLNLEVAKNLESPCANFQIALTSGTPFGITSEYISSASLVPHYDVSSGIVVVNGEQITVSALEDIEPPFHAYLDIVSAPGSAPSYSGNIVSAAGPYSPRTGHTAVYIGGVISKTNDLTGDIYDITSKMFDVGSKLTEYEIVQGDCITDVEFINGSTSGYVYMTVSNTGGKQYTTDRLLNADEFNNLTAENYSRGVQASAIVNYVSSHGGSGGSTIIIESDYDGPFKTTLEGGVLSIFDGSENTKVAGYAFIDGTHHVPVYTYRTAIVGTDAQDIYLMAYKQEPSSDSAQINAIYWQGNKYAKNGTEHGRYKWTAYKGEQQERSIYTTTAAPTASEEVYEFVDNVFIMLGYISDPTGDIGFRYQVGGTGWIHIDDVWFTRIARISGGIVEQVQYGDVHVKTTSDSGAGFYTGPWWVDVRNGTYYVSCTGCGNDEYGSSIVGFYRLNGLTESSLAGDIQGPAVNGAVYLHISAGGATVNTTADPESSAVYTVRLANITTGYACQMHYGNVYVDGRWM